MARADLGKELSTLKKDYAELKRDLARMVANGGAAAKSGARETVEGVVDAAGEARTKLMEEIEALFGKLREGAGNAVGAIKDKGTEVVAGAERTISDKPLTSVFAALGLGFVVGWLATRRR